MANVGRMDGAFFVSRTELLNWANSTFLVSLTKVEQCSNGALYCQVIDACHPGAVAMKRVNWSAKAEHDAIPNYKVLQQAFDRSGIQKHIEVDKLIRGKYQDNLEMLQWIKSYFDSTYQGDDYNPLERRFTNNLLDWAKTPRGDSSVSSHPSHSGSTRVAVDARPMQRRVDFENQRIREEYERLREEQREEIVDLKITVDGLETERDFYFQKLRDIEILCQSLEAQPNPDMTVEGFVESVQRVLYAKDDDDDGREEDVR